MKQRLVYLLLRLIAILFFNLISFHPIPSHLSSGQFYSLTDLRRDADLLPAMKGKVFALETFIYKGLLKQLSR